MKIKTIINLYRRWRIRNTGWSISLNAPIKNPLCSHPHKGYMHYSEVLIWEVK